MLMYWGRPFRVMQRPGITVSLLSFCPSPIQCRPVNQPGFLEVEGRDYVSLGLCSEPVAGLISFPSFASCMHPSKWIELSHLFQTNNPVFYGGVVTGGVHVSSVGGVSGGRLQMKPVNPSRIRAIPDYSQRSHRPWAVFTDSALQHTFHPFSPTVSFHFFILHRRDSLRST